MLQFHSRSMTCELQPQTVSTPRLIQSEGWLDKFHQLRLSGVISSALLLNPKLRPSLPQFYR